MAQVWGEVAVNQAIFRAKLVGESIDLTLPGTRAIS